MNQYNPNQGPLIGTDIEKGEHGTFFRVSKYKNRLQGGADIKTSDVVTVDSIQAEIVIIDGEIAKQQARKTKKLAEIAEIQEAE